MEINKVEGKSKTEELNEFKINIKGKKIAALGIGRSNIPAIKYFKDLGADITGFDKNENKLDICNELGIKFCLDTDKEDIYDGFNYIFRSPGVKPSKENIQRAILQGAILTSEIELLIKYCPCKVIGITGSDGKTTTSTLISKFLEKAGYKVWLGGNIGVPIFAKIDEINENDYVVLELSSFQLMTMQDSPNISVITNISPNHLDYHKDYDEYRDSKANIFLHQNQGDIVVLNKDDEYTKNYLTKVSSESKVKYFSLKNKVETGVYLKENNIVVNNLNNDGFEHIISDIKDVKLIGIHNIANICTAATAVIDITGIDAVKEVITKFTGVAHRMEFVKNINGVNWYNDSIGTSPTRTIAGLISFDKKIILIAGGYDKKIPYDNMGAYILDKVKILLLVGKTAPKIQEAVEAEAKRRGIVVENEIEIITLDTMEACVKLAYEKAKDSDNVVLSPASASFDLYKDFEERGNLFKQFVNELK